MSKSLRVGLYARISTHDQQTLQMQMEAMCAYAGHRGWIVTTEVKDVGSGSIQRPQRELLMKALEKFSGNQTQAARYLNISRRTLIYRMEKYHLRN